MKPQRIFFLAPARFDDLFQRHQAFAQILAARNNEVFYVDPVASPGFSVKIKKKSGLLRVLSLNMPFRAANFHFLQQLTGRLCLEMLKRRFKIGVEDLLWIADPSMVEVCKNDWAKIVYDRCDRHGFFPGQNHKAWSHYESQLFEKSDLIVASHKAILEDIPARWAYKALLCGNACADGFSEKMKGRVGTKLTERPLKVVSAGAHYEWVDCRWLQMIAKNENVELHLAGAGRGEEFAKLLQMPRVNFRGRLDQHELFSLYRESDVGLVPFKNSELVKAVDPIKVYEYAASGLQVWSTAVPSIADHPLVDRVVSSQSQLEQAVCDFAPTQKIRKVPCWSERLQTILDRMAGLQSD